MIDPSVQAEDLLAEGAGRGFVRRGLHGIHPRVQDIDPVKRLRLRVQYALESLGEEGKALP